MAAQTDRGVPLSTLCPKFLHSNSTSHTWPFSAIAELIDNAYDPDVSAKKFWIDKTVLKGQECLSFMDNGNGLDHGTMHRMLSFGYSDKVAVKGVAPIGMYGNGFKSGSMRLGKDAIVFSKSEKVSCVGMLSQTYLEKIGANQISVPIVCFEKRNKNYVVREEHKSSLKDILEYSPFKTERDLLIEVNAITNCSDKSTGTRIIIWNLCSTSTRPTEFDFETDRYDIRIPAVVHEEMNNAQHPVTANLHIPESLNSLRAYCSILYQKPRMQIIIRGQKVNTKLIAKSLAFRKTDQYRPTFLNKPIPITFGYNTKSKDQYGIMMYYKNRLIRAYERIGCQLKANNKGVGVIGVIDCYFLEPTHNKQSFSETDKYRKTMSNLATKLEEYWKEMSYRKKTENPNSTIPVEDTLKGPDQEWVQCDQCLRWRKLPDGIDCDKLPEKWFCHMNPDPQFRSCQVEEEAEDSEDEQPYCKTYKQQEKEDRKAEEEKRRREAKKLEEEQRRALLKMQKEALRRQETARSPSTSPRTVKQPGAAILFRSPLLTQAAYSPSSNSGLPVISSVCSLLPHLNKRKITQPATPETTLKKTKIKENSDTSTLLNMSLQNSPSVIIDDDDDDTDEDISILETTSSPNVKKVKMEPTSSLEDLMLWECNDDDDAPETSVAGTACVGSAAAGTSPTPGPPLPVSSSTTQTEGPKIKMEEEEQFKTEEEERACHSKSTETGSRQSLNVDIGVCTVEQRQVKLENSGDTHRANPRTQTLQNITTHSLDSDTVAGRPCANARDENQSTLHYPKVPAAVEPMQATAGERDPFQEKVQKLTFQLQDMKKSLQEPFQVNVKKECSHQATQTEETEGGGDYKALLEKVKQKNKLIKEKELLLRATESNPSVAECKEESDDVSLHVDRLRRELDERTKERDELRAKVDRLEMENDYLQIFSMEQQPGTDEARERITTPHRATGSTVQTDPAETGLMAQSDTNSVSDASRSLIELRHNIGRLLVSYVPALDLGQVNYECNVIDEILEQVLSNNGEMDGESHRID
ncbi:morc3 [Pungitius sinensis]